MFQVYRDFEKEVIGARVPELARKLNPAMLTFDQFLAKYKDKIPIWRILGREGVGIYGYEDLRH